jgi:tetratricopeptide (TPR) repeat protein
LYEADPDVDEVERLAREALTVFEKADDHAALAYVWFVLGFGVANFRGRYDDWFHAGQQELRHARLAGRRTLGFFSPTSGLLFGSCPADEALRTFDLLLPENPHPWPLLCRAWLLTMLARFDEAAELASNASRRMLDLTGSEAGDELLGQMAATAGRHEDAAIHLRRYCDAAEARGERGFLATLAPALGRSLCSLGRYEEAVPLAELGRRLSDERDPSSAALWRQVQALIDASNGDYLTGEKLAREAVDVTNRSDGLNLQGDALSDLARILQAAGRRDEAKKTFTEALDRYERKRNLAQASSVRDLLVALTRQGGQLSPS